MKNKKARENLIIGIVLGLIVLVLGLIILSFFLMFISKLRVEELIDCKTEEQFIDYKCEDGRKGFVTLKDWAKVHEGCHDYTYYHKCEGINQLIPSKKINHDN